MIIRYNKQTKTLILADKLPFFPKFKSVLCQTNNKILTSSRLQSATEKLSLTPKQKLDSSKKTCVLMLMMIRRNVEARVVLCLLAALSLARLRLNVGLLFLRSMVCLASTSSLHTHSGLKIWTTLYFNNFRKCLALLNSLLGAPINIQAIFLLKSRYFIC